MADQSQKVVRLEGASANSRVGPNLDIALFFGAVALVLGLTIFFAIVQATPPAIVLATEGREQSDDDQDHAAHVSAPF